MSFFLKIIRLYNTVKPLKWRQIIYRFIYKLKPVRGKFVLNDISCNNWLWNGPEVLEQSYFGEGKVKFLSKEGVVVLSSDWNNVNYEKLWLYNLHYFDDLIAIDSLSRKTQHLEWVRLWIQDNPPYFGNGWEPYTISLRLVNWIKWYSRARIEDKNICISIAHQANTLCGLLEYHILGNHLFANAKALIFAGCFLKGKIGEKCLSLGIRTLKKQLPEQFLNDGGHFERSPMYHEILLWDLLDLINLAHLSKNQKLTSLLEDLSTYSQRAFRWLKVMTHPDGEISFFNDSAFGIAPSPEQIFNYAKTLKLTYQQQYSLPLTTLPDSGYSRIEFPLHTLIFDHAALGPTYLLGHAHADTLSFEWSIGLQRIVVNSGTSIYGVSRERLRQRQTAAHSTVVVENQDSSEVWSGFRVARCANSILELKDVSEHEVTLIASHDGYRRLKNKVIHRREIRVGKNSIRVRDNLIGRFEKAEAIFYFHPNIKLEYISSGELSLSLPAGDVVYLTASAPIYITESTWHPQFGASLANKKIFIPFIDSDIEIIFSIKPINNEF